MKKAFPWWLALALLAACSPEPKRHGGNPGTITTNIAWRWDSFPLADKMKIGVLPCQLQPRSQMAINAPLTGVLRVHLSQPQAAVEAGFVWAEFEPEILKAEATALEEARVKLDEREKLQAELEIPRQKLQLERQIEEMHALKTGALIRASVLMACAAAASLRQADRDALDRYGSAVGLSFQIVDDLLDVLGDPAVTGKVAGSDALRGKPTYPAIAGVQAACARATELAEAGVAALAAFGPEAACLREFAGDLVLRGR